MTGFERDLSLWVLAAILTGLGLNSGAALVIVVGVKVDVPVMLDLFAVANRTRAWFPA